MKPEIHIILIWEKGLGEFASILYDLKNNFDILEVFKIKWSSRFFSNNLSRFYGEKLSDGSFKEKHCGKGDFVVIIIRDNNPSYETRETSIGKELVNAVLFDKKQLYRNWTGGGHKIHTSNNIKESRHDIFFLLQKSLDDFLEKDKWDGVITDKKKDIKGFNGWSSFTECFDFINSTSSYVILRNYEDIEKLSLNSDIDILSTDRDFHYYINGIKKHRYKDRAAYKIIIHDNEYNTDIRLQGDGYYDSNWVLNIIENRILYKNRFFIPDPVNEFYCLLYHILIHKNELSDKYYDTLIRLASKIDLKLDSNILGNRRKMLNLLNIFLREKNYKITNPKDFSVQYNYPGKGLKRIVWEKLGEIKNG